MKLPLLIVVAVALGGCRGAPQPAAPVARDDEATRKATREKMLADLRAKLARDPNDATSLFYVAELEAKLGRNDAALDALAKLDALGWDIALDDDLFPSVRDTPRYRDLAARISARAPHAATSAAAFTISERGLIPEGIAFDPRDGAFFVSSIAKRKVVRVDARGARDLVHSSQDGLMEALGMKIDPKRNALWVASADEKSGDSGVFAFDPSTGALERKALLHGGHLMNDVAFDERGSVFVTDSTGGGVFLLVPAADKLLPYIEPGTFVYPNGIALSDAKARIFVAHLHGIAVVDRTTKSIRPLAHDARVPLAGIDGLALHERALYAVQNGLGKPRVVRIDLDEALDRVERLTVLENESPALHIPTTGVVANGAFHFIANSQLDVADGPAEKWRETIVLAVPL